MFQLVYVSSARVPFAPQQLIDLLSAARRKNERLDITGMLLYHDGNFMQALEGPDEIVRSVFHRIDRDLRHQGLITLLQRPIEERQFADWSMGFRDLSDPEVRDLPGYSEFMNSPLTGQEFTREPTRALHLLSIFKQTSLR